MKAGDCFPQVEGKDTSHHQSERMIEFRFRSGGLHPRPLVSRLGRTSLFLPLREQHQQQHADLIKVQREGSRRVKDGTCERITMRSWKQKPDVISHPSGCSQGSAHWAVFQSVTGFCQAEFPSSLFVNLLFSSLFFNLPEISLPV